MAGANSISNSFYSKNVPKKSPSQHSDNILAAGLDYLRLRNKQDSLVTTLDNLISPKKENSFLSTFDKQDTPQKKQNLSETPTKRRSGLLAPAKENGKDIQLSKCQAGVEKQNGVHSPSKKKLLRSFAKEHDSSDNDDENTDVLLRLPPASAKGAQLIRTPSKQQGRSKSKTANLTPNFQNADENSDDEEMKPVSGSKVLTNNIKKVNGTDSSQRVVNTSANKKRISSMKRDLQNADDDEEMKQALVRKASSNNTKEANRRTSGKKVVSTCQDTPDSKECVTNRFNKHHDNSPALDKSDIVTSTIQTPTKRPRRDKTAGKSADSSASGSRVNRSRIPPSKLVEHSTKNKQSSSKSASKQKIGKTRMRTRSESSNESYVVSDAASESSEEASESEDSESDNVKKRKLQKNVGSAKKNVTPVVKKNDGANNHVVSAKNFDETEFEPMRFLRCHFGELENLKSDVFKCDPTDNKTKIWSCQFEPDPDMPGQTRSVVATCGGNTMCVIDCATGSVLKRYRKGREMFYTVAWSTVTLPKELGGHRSNILAVAGHNAHVKLFWPEQAVCYAEFGDGRPKRSVTDYYINNAVFHPTFKTLLFAGASDETVTIFNVELPYAQPKTSSEREQQVLISPCGGVARQAFSADATYLIAACVNGVCVWPLPDNEAEFKTNKRAKGIEVTLPGLEDDTVDGLSRVENNIFAVKATGVPNIFLCKFPDNLSKVKGKNVTVEVLRVLQWAETEVDFIDLTACLGSVFCGDDCGSVWQYDNVLTGKTTLQAKPPSKKLLWPRCVIASDREDDQMMTDVIEDGDSIVCNCIALDSNGQFLVTGTDNNMVCIWQRMTLVNKR